MMKISQEIAEEALQDTAAVQEAQFCKIRSLLCFKGCEEDIERDMKHRIMVNLGLNPNAWSYYEGLYRKRFDAVSRAIAAGVRTNRTQKVDVGNVTAACLESHTLKVPADTCRELTELTQHMDKFLGSCLAKATSGRGKRKVADAGVTKQYVIGDRFVKNIKRTKAFAGSRPTKKDKK